jgi:hypothetical protein
MSRRHTLVVLLLSGCLNSFGQWLGFEIDQTIQTSTPVYQIVVAKTDADLYPDIVALSVDRFTEGTVFGGDKDGKFYFDKTFSKQENYRVVEADDLNGDGIDDLAISGYWNNGFQLFWGSANGEYSAGDHYALTGHGKNLKIVDINKDGANDIVALSGGSGQPITLHVFIGNNTKVLSPKGIFGSQLDTDKRITIVDKNQDGFLDIMIASSFPWFMIYYQDANGNFTPRYWPYKLELPFTSEYYLDDLNNDGQEDIIAFYFDEGFRFYDGKRDTLFSTEYKSLPFKAEPTRIFTEDINLDGNVDILFGTYTDEWIPTNEIKFMLGKGDFTFEDEITLQLPASAERFILADYNADSFPDIIAYCADKGIVTVPNKGLLTAVEEKATTNFYPNPFSDKLFVDKTLDQRVEVYNSMGLLIHTIDKGYSEISTDDWADGVYFLKCVFGKRIVVHKLVKS